MPFVQAPTKVLVSGTNGYVTIWVVQNLLSKGYSVHGTVHSAEKGKHMKKLFANFGDKHEVVVVNDTMKVSESSEHLYDLSTWAAGTQEGDFDEAVKGVDTIEHTVLLFHLKADDPDGASWFTIRISLHIEAHHYLVLELIV